MVKIKTKQQAGIDLNPVPSDFKPGALPFLKEGGVRRAH